ncbi:hypothetical protein chiPu_0001214 [Chiloscyllium punctatum]|uniref:Uncharacterized protein n=1 Tax=Chiloscyllium punctatum TaxID=137246 RepID=A0A401RXD8_CHIPU|nr:hypothetical protein [Chiloscyllium punctatum]
MMRLPQTLPLCHLRPPHYIQLPYTKASGDRIERIHCFSMNMDLNAQVEEYEKVSDEEIEEQEEKKEDAEDDIAEDDDETEEKHTEESTDVND